MDVDALRRFASEGLTRADIAQKMGMSYSRTTTVLRENGIEICRKKHACKPRGPRDQTKRIIQLRKQGLLIQEIANTIGCCKDTVKAACRKYGLTQQQNKTTEDDAINLVRLAGYEYVGGFVNTHSKLIVRCPECGNTFERMYKNIREKAIGTYDNDMRCPTCYSNSHTKERDRKQAQHDRAEREAHKRAQRKAEQNSRRISDELARRLAIHVCKNCNNEFCIECSGYNSETYCSEKCQKRYVNRVKSEKRIEQLKRRKHDTDITLEKLFKRDGGLCYICGCVCDWGDIATADGTMVAGERYPSIDHVRPVSKGGTHTWDNIRLACRHCNTLKGNR